MTQQGTITAPAPVETTVDSFEHAVAALVSITAGTYEAETSLHG